MSAEQTHAEWAASLSVSDVDVIIGRCVKAKDFESLRAGEQRTTVRGRR